ncbi:hypothetical protein C8R43DRAFT_1134308 [Mycena crocata]|nr:hypothetical protein C8R43DRAFT_1134308 [Mycena crocata]
MEQLDPAKRVTRSQLPLPDSHLSLSRSPLKDARIAQRNYHMDAPEHIPDPAEDEDEILLSPGKNRHFNSRVNAISKRSASPPPQDEYTDSVPSQDGRELKRMKMDETPKRDDSQKRDGGSDTENTDTNIRPTASHARNHSEPVVGPSRRSNKPRSASKQTPTGKGRARSVPVFPVLDLSNPPTTPWRRRARSRSPSKELDSPKFKITFSSLASIPDEAAMPPPALPPSTSQPNLPTAPAHPTMPPPPIIEPPSTPAASVAYHLVFATPMSPLTPMPETPRPFQPHADPLDGIPRTIGWGVPIPDAKPVEGLPATSSDASSLFPIIATAPPPPSLPDDEKAAVESAPAEDTQLRDTAEASKPTKALVQSRLPRPSIQAMPPPPVPTKTGIKSSSMLMGPPPVPAQSSSSSTSTSGAPKNAFTFMMNSARSTGAKGKGKAKDKVVKPVASTSTRASAMASTSSSTSTAAGSSKAAAKAPAVKGKGKAKEKVEEKPKEEKKASVKAKMRPREKPKPLPLPIHVRLPDESDGERTSTPTAASRPETPTTEVETAEKLAVQSARRFSSPLTEIDDEEESRIKVEEEETPTVQLVRRPSSPLTEPDEDPLIDDYGPIPPASSSPDIFLSPDAGPQLSLPEPPPEPLTDAPDGPADGDKSMADVEVPAEAPQLAVESTSSTDVAMDCADEHITPADVSMSGDHPAPPPPDPEPKAARLKSRVGKPRAPAPLPVPADRVTRSASLKRKEAEGGAPTQKKLFSFGVGPVAAVGNPPKKQKTSSEAGPSTSPTKIPVASSKRASFASPTKASAARATTAKNKPVSAAAAPSGGSPSPTKNRLARSSSLFTARPPPSFTRTFTGPGGNPSSLQTLASALEKLRMPPPERPNTSMGFSRDDTDSTLAESTRSMDDRSIGIGRPSGALQRASTVASIASASSSTSSLPGESSKPTTSAVPPLKSALVQRPIHAFMNKGGVGATSKLTVGSGSIMRGPFGAASRSAPKVSRHPGLPSVMGSPVKGGGDGDATMMEEDLTEADLVPTIERVTSPRGVTFDLSIIGFEPSKKGKEKERLPEEWRQNASRRASMAGQDLSKSVSLPPKPVGLMGPPETPLDRVGMRSSSSSYPASSTDPSGSAGAEGMRRSTRIAKTTPPAETSVDEDTPVSVTTPVQPLTVLKGCIVFVDVISGLGDNSASSFITEMLKNLGARVLGSVGNTCTHIVYKNGVRSTYTRYKALADPKPHVVGMEWVIQSAEKRIHEDETPYLIDMDDMNTTTKRRKSMLPRLMSGGLDDDVEGDYSYDGSSSSMIVDDDLAPLERARLRKAGTLGI